MQSNRILLFDPQRRTRREAIRILTAAGCEVVAPESFKKLEETVIEQQFIAYVLDLEGHQHLTSKGIELAMIPTIILSQSPLSETLPYLSDLRYFTNFVAKGPRNHLNHHDLLGTIAKIIHNDIFGVKKYLSWGAHTNTFHLRESSSRREYVDHLKDWGRNMGVRSSIIKHIEVVTEELLMNAIYDAPIDARGNRTHNHKARTEQVLLPLTQAARIEYGSDGRRVAISVTDPFGSITRDLVLRCLTRCYAGRDLGTMQESGGAGLGLFFCYKHVDSLVINVDPLKRTEFIGLIDIDQSVRESKLAQSHTALHFFNTDNYSPLFLGGNNFQVRKKSA
ncbi:MAG: hypothetical protein ACOVS5_17130 [Oligoflexus sp.]|jgi:hypothetical protein